MLLVGLNLKLITQLNFLFKSLVGASLHGFENIKVILFSKLVKFKVVDKL